VEVTQEGLAQFFGVALPHLNEVQRRVVAGASAEMLGRGGKSWVGDASGMSRNTVIKLRLRVRLLRGSHLGPGCVCRARGVNVVWDYRCCRF
jgi:hypothetical protein